MKSRHRYSLEANIFKTVKIQNYFTHIYIYNMYVYINLLKLTAYAILKIFLYAKISRPYYDVSSTNHF